MSSEIMLLKSSNKFQVSLGIDLLWCSWNMNRMSNHKLCIQFCYRILSNRTAPSCIPTWQRAFLALIPFLQNENRTVFGWDTAIFVSSLCFLYYNRHMPLPDRPALLLERIRYLESRVWALSNDIWHPVLLNTGISYTLLEQLIHTASTVISALGQQN